MVREGDLVAIFNNIHRVMKAEKLLKERRIGILLIPAPRSLRSDCGLAIRYEESSRDSVERCLSEEGLLPEETYRRSGEGFVLIEKHGVGSSSIDEAEI